MHIVIPRSIFKNLDKKYSKILDTLKWNTEKCANKEQKKGRTRETKE